MKQFEEHHNSTAQVRDYLAHALGIVAELEVDDDLKPHAFVKAVDLLSAKTLQVVPDTVRVPAMAIPRQNHG